MVPESKPQLGLDTNILFDLADEKDFAGTVLEVLKEEKATVKVSPTVLVEIEYEIMHPASPQKARRAERALHCLPSWGVTPFSLAPIQLAIAAEFSRSLQHARILPDGEFHDGCILAETALCPLEYLLTSDVHLLSMNREKLKAMFEERGLPIVQIVSARSLYALLKQR
jgi:predicted nucleic acid-binding protein